MTASTLFDNFLSADSITPVRLRNFAGSTINRLKADTVHDWNPLISLLEGPYSALNREIGDVDAAVNAGLGHTDTVDEMLSYFRKYMSAEAPFIARAVGGKGTPAYLKFYPAGITEYSDVNKTTAQDLLSRITALSNEYRTVLGEERYSSLQGFEPAYLQARNMQQGNKGSITGNRGERSEARKAVEIAMLRAVHQVGNVFPGNVAMCAEYFDFERLYRPRPTEDG